MKIKFAIIMVIISLNSIFPQETIIENPITPEIKKGVPVLFKETELFRVYSTIGPFTAENRSQAITSRLTKITELKSFKKEELQIIKSEFTTDIVFRSEIIMSITPADSIEAGKEMEVLANEYYAIIHKNLIIDPKYILVENPNDLYSLIITNKENLIHIGISAASFLFLLFSIYFNGILFRKIIFKIKKITRKKFGTASSKRYKILSKEAMITSMSLLLNGIKFFIVILFLYSYINLLFYLFPWSDYLNVKSIIWGILLTFFSIIIWFSLYKLLKLVFEIFNNNIAKKGNPFIKPLIIKNMTVFSDIQLVLVFQRISLFFQFICNLFLLYIFIPIVFSFFEFSNNWANTLFGYVLDPLKKIAGSFINFLPNLIFVIVIVVVNRYLSKLSKLFFDQIKSGNVKISGFHTEWADPTYKIVRFLIIVFTIIMVYPYLPGSDSEAFKGVSVLLGILFSLGSTSIIANAVSGIILTYMYAFTEGDRVKIGDTIGDVVEKTLLVTRIKTVKNVIVSIPNSSVMSNHIINYSSAITKDYLILHTSITLGYDVPWRKVHTVLIDAANKTANVMKSPAPFVLQTSLDDYYVAYELNVYTDKPHSMAKIYSELHQNMQDTCNENGIEILSPRYEAIRDGNQSTIPEDYLPKTYNAPKFRVDKSE